MSFEEAWIAEARQTTLGSLEISKELAEELQNRLAPFCFQDHIISAYVHRGESLGFPFTHVLDILDYANDKPEKITVPRKLANKELQLIANSRAGALTQKFGDELKQKGLEEGSCPLSVNDKDYVFSLEKDEKEILSQRRMDIAMGRTSEGYSEADFIRYLPFKISMIELGKYYRVDTHQDYKENLVVVIGNEVTDYCFYYCLSRMHEGVYWLPDNFLKDANDKVSANEGRTTEEREKFTEVEEFAASMVTPYFRKIGSGYEQKRISIVSTSLNDEHLRERKLWMGNIPWLSSVEFSSGRDFLDSVVVTPLSVVSVHCVGRVIETNNYANQQDIVFQDGKSVGRLNTPKPKNFSFANPANHRWITSVEANGYRPRHLNENGILTRGGKAWHKGTLRNMSVKPAYAGIAIGFRWERKPGAKSMTLRAEEDTILLPEGTIPPIITPAERDQILRQFELNKQASQCNSKYPDVGIMKGRVKCGTCGKSCYICHPTIRGKEVFSYQCRYMDSLVKHTTPTVVVHLLDDAAWALATEHIKNPQLILDRVEQIMSSQLDQEHIDRLNAQLVNALPSGSGSLLVKTTCYSRKKQVSCSYLIGKCS